MTLGAATIRLLIDMGHDIDDLLLIAESMEREANKERSAGAKRQASYRKRKKAAAFTGDVTSDVTQSVTPRACVEDNLPSQESFLKKSKKTPRDDMADFKRELSELAPDLLDEFVKLRRGKRALLTGYSARLFLKDCEACGLSVTAAANMCISRNWLTVKPEYLTTKKPCQTAPPQRAAAKETLASMWRVEA